MNVIETQHLNIVFYVPFLVVMNVSSPRYVCSGLIRAVSWVRRLVVANWSYQTEQRTRGHRSRLRQSIRWAQPSATNILNQERVVRSLSCLVILSSEKNIFRCDFMCLKLQLMFARTTDSVQPWAVAPGPKYCWWAAVGRFATNRRLVPAQWWSAESLQRLLL